MVTDNIADMLTRIRNANMVKHQIVEIPATKMSKMHQRVFTQRKNGHGFVSPLLPNAWSSKNINTKRIYLSVLL